MIWVALLFALSQSTTPAAAPSPAEDPLVGLWATEVTFGPALRGNLTLTRDGLQLRATLGNAGTTFARDGNSIRFAFSGNRGGFRGALDAGERAVTGFWLQPPGGPQDPRDPGGSGQSFASPLVLHRVGRNAWRGTVEPLEDRFTLYLKIFRDPSGALLAAFRNPDQNSIGGTTQFRVTREGESDTVLFRAGRDPAQPEIRHTATLLRSPDRLRIAWPDAGGTLELTRATPAQAAGFFPRPSGAPPYVFGKPPATGDGWETARARAAGMDEAVLERLVRRLADADPSVRRPALIHSLLVAHRGKLVLEEYFFGFDRERRHDIRSAGKTFGSVLLGAAMMRGKRVGPETPVYGLLAGMGPFAHPDPRKATVTVAHLMTHTSGLACDDNDEASPGNELTMQTQKGEPDWWKYTLNLPMAHDPGSRYAYCSANSNLVGAVLKAATGTSLPELFEQWVARPLQFGRYYWNLMPTGDGYLGGGAFLRPRDFLKVGQAYLDGGVWRRRRIVDASWVARSTAPSMKVSPETTGLDKDRFPEFYGEGEDAYAWHLNRLRSGERTYREYEATGNGGQLLMVVPELDLVVVFTGGNYGQGGIWGRFRDQIVPQEIIPAIRR
ncbi:MAG TPA: serine hydrolase [Thermoanaerobaculia bacterium]